MNISDEALVAAAWEISAVDYPNYEPDLEVARKVLEAAAPHIAAAWHDAVSEAYVEGALSADQASIMWNKNPYRSQA
jgi:hypothetical protein